jgi:hypothetical protein
MAIETSPASASGDKFVFRKIRPIEEADEMPQTAGSGKTPWMQ